MPQLFNIHETNTLLGDNTRDFSNEHRVCYHYLTSPKVLRLSFTAISWKEDWLRYKLEMESIYQLSMTHWTNYYESHIL